MVKLKTGQITGVLKAPPPQYSAFLVYGPDRGLVRERCQMLAKTIVDDITDPFQVATLTGRDITEDPTRLHDEANALSMMGGRRLVRIKDASDGLSRPLAAVLQTINTDTLIVIEGGDLPARSGLRKLVEAADNAATLPCYLDEGQTLNAVIAQTLGAARLRPDRDAMEYLMTHLGGDRQITLSELEKIILFKGVGKESEERTVTLDEVQAIIGDSADLSIEDAVQATASGHADSLERTLDLCFSSGLASIQIIRAHMRHFQRLHITTGHMADGLTMDAAMNKLIPKVFFKQQNSFRQQLSLWPNKKLITAIGLLEEAEIQCKTTGMPDVVICRRVLLRLARATENR